MCSCVWYVGEHGLVVTGLAAASRACPVEPDGRTKVTAAAWYACEMDQRVVNRAVIEAFRAGRNPEGLHRDRLLLLTTTGRRTGRERTTPMMFHCDSDRLMVIASNAGAVRDPEWFRNLLSDSRVVVEVGEERYAAAARVLTGAEYDSAWADITARFPFFLDHQAAVQRRIPVVELARRDGGPDRGATPPVVRHL